MPDQEASTRKAVRQWLQRLPLPRVDRLEMDHLLARWRCGTSSSRAVDERIAAAVRASNAAAQLLATIVGRELLHGPGDRRRGSATSTASRRPRSLANYWGLTPSCRTRGETARLGSITKEGSLLARFLLGQLVLHVLRRDARMRAWYQADQKAAGLEDRAGGRDAAPGGDLLAHAEQGGSVRVRRGAAPVATPTRATLHGSGVGGPPPREPADAFGPAAARTEEQYRFLFSLSRRGGRVMPGVNFAAVRQQIAMAEVLRRLQFEPRPVRRPARAGRVRSMSGNPRSRSFSVNVRWGRSIASLRLAGERPRVVGGGAETTLSAAAIELCELLGIDVPWIQRW